jgi:hypothetical protein
MYHRSFVSGDHAYVLSADNILKPIGELQMKLCN